MGDEADDGRFFLGVGLESGIDVTHFVHFHITESLVFELLLQKLGKLQLLRRTGNTLRVFARLGVKPCITDKSFCKIHILCYEDVIVNENKRNHSRPYAKERGFLLIVQLLFCFLPLYTIKMSQIYKKCLILKTVYHIFPY